MTDDEIYAFYNLKSVLSGAKNRSNAWECVNYLRETIDIVKDNAPDLFELSFIDEKLASVEMLLMKCIDNLKIDKPKGFVLREWHGSTGPYVSLIKPCCISSM